MKLVTAHLVDFRNVSAKLEFSPGINVLVGRNGQGKSNILEALHVVAVGSSFRPGKLGDLVRFDQPAARVELGIEEAEVVTPVIFTVTPGGQRQITVGGKENGSLAEVASHLRVVFFGPEDLGGNLVIKLDIEGAEVAAVQGMSHLIQRHGCVTLFTEFLPLGLEQFGSSDREYFCLLRDLGFAIHHINNRTERLEPLATIDPILGHLEQKKLTNLLCVRERQSS